YRVVPLAVLVDCLRGGAPFPQHAVAITFDDGYRDNFIYARPILGAFGFAATVYVTTGAVGDGWRFWPSRVRCALLETTRDGIHFDLGQVDLSTTKAREDAVGRVTKHLKLLTVEERELRVARLLADLGHE